MTKYENLGGGAGAPFPCARPCPPPLLHDDLLLTRVYTCLGPGTYFTYNCSAEDTTNPWKTQTKYTIILSFMHNVFHKSLPI